MRILAPLRSIDEIDPLCEAGADDFYCGLVDAGGALNGRPNTDEYSFSSSKSLRTSVVAAHAKGKRVFLAMNSLLPLNMTRALRQAQVARNCGVDGLILANVFLIKKLRDLKLGLELQASSLTATLNHEAVAFVQALGITHIHLPTQMGLGEIKKLINDTQGVQFSVFIAGGTCMNIEGVCSLHGVDGGGVMVCRYFHTLKVMGQGSKVAAQFDESLKKLSSNCGLCALKDLQKMGIYSLKVEGRNMTLESKRSKVTMVRKGIEAIRSSHSVSGFIGQCKQISYDIKGTSCNAAACHF